MRSQIVCFSLLFMASGLVYAAAVPIQPSKEAPKKEAPLATLRDFKTLVGQPDEVLKKIVAELSDADVAHFQRVSSRFYDIGQAELMTRASYWWKESGEIVPTTFPAHQGPVVGVFVSKEGNIISVGRDHHIYVWRWDDAEYTKIKEMTDSTGEDVLSVQFSPATNRILIRYWNNDVDVWNVQTGKQGNQFMLNANLNDCVLSPDGNVLATTFQDKSGIIQLWDAAKVRHPRIIDTHLTETFSDLAFSPDGKKLAFQENSTDRVIIWNLKTNAKEGEFPFEKKIATLSFMRDGTLIAFKDNYVQNLISVWDVQMGKKMSEWKYENYQVIYSRRLSHDCAIFAGEVQQTKIYLWHTQSGKILKKLDIEGNTIMRHALTFSPDDKMLVAGCLNGNIVIWKATPPEKQKEKSTK